MYTKINQIAKYKAGEIHNYRVVLHDYARKNGLVMIVSLILSLYNFSHFPFLFKYF